MFEAIDFRVGEMGRFFERNKVRTIIMTAVCLCAFRYGNGTIKETIHYKVDALNEIENNDQLYEEANNFVNNENDYKEVNLYNIFKRSAEKYEARIVFNVTDTNVTSISLHEKILDIKDLLNLTDEDVYDHSMQSDCVGSVEFCNMTKEEYMQMLNDYIFPQPYEWVLIVTHAIVFVIGLIGNALVCVAVYRNHSMRTVTNCFIVNLAVADFMVILFCLPPTVLWDVTETWFFGNALCRIILYFQSVSVTVSVLTLTFISVDRWYAICFPLKFKSTTGRAKTAILIIWLLSLLFNIPEFVVLEAHRKTELRFDVQYFIQCTPTWSTESDLNWHIIKALVLYTFPLILMIIAYYQIIRVLWRSDNIPGHTESHKHAQAGQNNWLAASRRTTMSVHANASTEGQLRSRRKAARMLVAVVAMFAACYFPVHLLSVLRYAFDIQQTELISCIALVSHVLCYANSAINPLIYNFMSGKFRREFHRSFFKCSCFGATVPDRTGASFAPVGSSRAGTTRTVVRRNDSCASYRLAHLSPSNARDCPRTNNTSFIENNNANRKRIRNDSLTESTRFSVDNRE